MKFYNTKEAARYLGVGTSFLYNTRNKGKRPHSINYGPNLVPGYMQDELDDYREANPLTIMFKCHKCKTLKVRTRGEKMGNNLGFKFSDENGSPWESTVCPPCSTVRVLSVTKRNCRNCREPLSASRYFECEECRPILREDVGIFIYS